MNNRLVNLSSLKFETGLFAAAFLLGLAIRLAGIDHTPLGSTEADLALQSLALVQGKTPLLAPHPLYLVLTTLWMYLFGAANWTARFWPVLAGSLLVLLPGLFRSRLGRLPAVLMAFGLAIDPGLLAVSREAGSRSLALFCAVLALGLWFNRRPVGAGIAAGLALLGGPSIWPGLIGFAAAAAVARRLGWIPSSPAQKPTPEPQPGAQIFDSHSPVQPTHGAFLAALMLTLAAAGTLLFFIPSGLNAGGQSIAVYFSGWAAGLGQPAGSGITPGLFLLGLSLYELLPILLAVGGGLNAWRRRSLAGRGMGADRFLVLWWAAALLLAVLYPARALADGCWALIPMWALAARQAVRLSRVSAEDRLPVIGQALLAGVIFGFLSMGVVSMTNAPAADPLEGRVRLAGAVIMLVASTALIAWGWSRRVAGVGLVWGAGIVLFVYFAAAAWNSAGLSGRDSVDLWTEKAPLRDARLIADTLRNLDEWGPLNPGGPDVVVVDLASPALRWQLRNLKNIAYVSALNRSASPAVVITQVEPNLALASAYRGETFVLDQTAAWNNFTPANWLLWQVFRTTPNSALIQEKVILWARSDLFPGGSAPAGAAPAAGAPQ